MSFRENERVLHNVWKREHCREVFLSDRRLSVLDEAQDFGRNRKIVVEARADNQSDMHRRGMCAGNPRSSGRKGISRVFVQMAVLQALRE